jgi:hypothetical protein
MDCLSLGKAISRTKPMIDLVTDELCFTHGQWESKIWLVEKLEQEIQRHSLDFSDTHVLGSWLGLLGMVMYSRGFPFKHLHNYDLSERSLEKAKIFLDSLRVTGRLTQTQQDVNLLTYANDNILVCNTSVDNIEGSEWFDRIPSGALVALQTRSGNNVNDEVNVCNSLAEFKWQFPLKDVLYLGSKYFSYPEFSYYRYMLIGIK